MKILFTSKNLNVGGVGTSLIFLINRLIESGHEVDLMVYESGELFDKLNKKANILYYDDYFKNVRKDKLLRIKKNVLVKNLYNRYKGKIKKDYDISVAYYGFDNYIDMVAATVNSKKKIIWVHNDFYSSIKNKRFPFLYKIMYKKMSHKFAYFNKIVCVSKYTEENFNKLFGYEDKTTTIHNYIDFDYITSSLKEKNEIKFDKEKFNIVSVGRLTKLKNFDKVIMVGNELKKRNIKFHIYIIGGGEEYNNLQNLINSLNLNDDIELLGNIGSRVYSAMKSADLLLSMSQYESFGNVLIESMIVGVPYLSNINSGSKDIYENLTPKGMGTIAKNDDILNELLSIMNNHRTKIIFDTSKYNTNINKKLDKIFTK